MNLGVLSQRAPLPSPQSAPNLPTHPAQGNKLGTAFIEATERTGATAWHDLFDTSIFEIKHTGEAGREAGIGGVEGPTFEG